MFISEKGGLIKDQKFGRSEAQTRKRQHKLNQTEAQLGVIKSLIKIVKSKLKVKISIRYHS